MDIYEVLRRDHARILALCDRVSETPESDPMARREAFAELKRLVEVHTEAEAQLFYPRFQDDEQYRTDALEALGEHDKIGLVLDELDQMPKDDEHWMPTFSSLAGVMRRHLVYEEQVLFVEAQRVIGEDEASPLGDRVEEFETHLP